MHRTCPEYSSSPVTGSFHVLIFRMHIGSPKTESLWYRQFLQNRGEPVIEPNESGVVVVWEVLIGLRPHRGLI